MNWKNLLDQVLDAGKEMAEKGQTIAEDKLNIPAEGDTRDASLDGMKKGAMAAGALALLLGTKTGRKVTGSAIKLGSLAAVGGLAYKAYQNWQENNAVEANQSQVALPATDIQQEDANSLVLLKAMLAAANADGHIDETELATIRERLQAFDLDANLADLTGQTLTAQQVAELSDSVDLSAQIYLVSNLVLSRDSIQDEVYRQELIQALNLADSLVEVLDKAGEEASLDA
jgi:uncharacterized membrane protein YebE (DUF533 family)